MQKVIHYIIILLFAVYVFALYLTGQLDFYIHPRYMAFTYVMALVTMAFCVVFAVRMLEQWYKNRQANWTGHWHPDGSFHAEEHAEEGTAYVEKNDAHRDENTQVAEPHHHEHHSHSETGRLAKAFGVLLLVLPLAVGFLLPVKPLSAATAEQRIIDLNALRRRDVSTADLFIKNTKTYTMGDWIAAFNANPDFQKYVGKQVNVTGFVFDPLRSDEYFMAARFVITCCAVDARPIGLYVQSEWRNQFKESSWVQVEGKFVIVQIAGQDTLAVLPEKISAVPTPADPYVY